MASVPVQSDRKSSRYVVDYDNVVFLSAAPRDVWRALEDVDRLARWSVWVQHLHMDSDRFRPGVAVDVGLSTPLPVRLRLRIVIEDCDPTALLVAKVEGDLAGSARLRLMAEGSGTRAELSWSFEMMHNGMRAMAMTSGRLMRWGHDAVAAATIRSFAHRLSAP
jgi:carbon monoxide dehydrogenase subunit G